MRDANLRAMESSRLQKSASAFTLIELLVVIAVIAILAGIALPVFNSVQERARATQDLNNLRQLGIATQTYLNDHDNALFSDQTTPWMKQLLPKYLPSWKIFQSPFDKRSPLEDPTTSPVSYGLNGNPAAAGILMDKIVRPSAFILFAPAQNSSATVGFTGTAAGAVTVYKAQSTPGGTAPGGTQSARKRINAVFADLHSDSLTWSDFITDNGAPNSDANYRWDPAGNGATP
ncbi:MAG TPA: type II secretion system protein [Chthoniobacterales bacterium]